MKQELNDYDIYPKLLPAGKESTVVVCGRGAHSAFCGSYNVHVHRLSQGDPNTYPNRKNDTEYKVEADQAGRLRFTHLFPTEEEYFIRITQKDEYGKQRNVVRLSVYAVGADLVGRLPLVGDLHLHTCRSDGKQAPAVVACAYRSLGYDFMAITDHGRYYPSLEAMEAFVDTDCDVCLVTGEEVHLPGNDLHIINFGSGYSVNGLVESLAQYQETKGDPALSSWGMTPPAPMSEDDYRAQINALAESLEIPEGVEKFPYAACVWAFDHIRKGGGLGVFPHPCWIVGEAAFQVPDTLRDYLMETHPFDAFEVLGGESYYEQNGFQTQIYYEDRARGRKYPVVGSTDSHNCYPINRNYDVCRTMVFAPQNRREDLVASIRAGYSVAIDTISKEPRFVGEFRLVKLAVFLWDNFFPLHDEIARWDGMLMNAYQCATDEAEKKELAEKLGQQKAMMEKLRKKYIVGADWL